MTHNIGIALAEVILVMCGVGFLICIGFIGGAIWMVCNWNKEAK